MNTTESSLAEIAEKKLKQLRGKKYYRADLSRNWRLSGSARFNSFYEIRDVIKVITASDELSEEQMENLIMREIDPNNAGFRSAAVSAGGIAPAHRVLSNISKTA